MAALFDWRVGEGSIDGIVGVIFNEFMDVGKNCRPLSGMERGARWDGLKSAMETYVVSKRSSATFAMLRSIDEAIQSHRSNE